MFSFLKRKPENPLKFYNEIPLIENGVAKPGKLFVIEQQLMKEFIVRALDDNKVRRGGVINTFEGPYADETDFRIQLDFERAFDLLTKQKEMRSCNPFFLPEKPSFQLGAVDIVTFPFHHALVSNIDIAGNTSEILWRINNNLVNQFLPHNYRNLGALSVFHFNEEPIDDAPIHNIFLFEEKVTDEFNRKYKTIVNSSLLPIYVDVDSSVMDDRYVYQERRKEDGPPFNLELITKALFS
ncbi:hypothetical protein AB6E06_24695 [Vibrio splendidus]